TVCYNVKRVCIRACHQSRERTSADVADGAARSIVERVVPGNNVSRHADFSSYPGVNCNPFYEYPSSNLPPEELSRPSVELLWEVFRRSRSELGAGKARG
ncbi:hypothetical protein J6590_106409, partial [Homalodisca vitripennis]